jgi:hypothetical protein
MSKANGSFDADFEEFWRLYPRRVGKIAAQKEYDKVRRGGTTQDELLDGITQYVKTKPSYADYCHPRTWLAQGRWMDEAPTSRPAWTCPHDPPCAARGQCDVRSRIAAGKNGRV